MARLPRSETIDESEVGVYHIIARTVRRAFLLGYKKTSGMDTSYRKGWVLDRLKFLSHHYAIDTCAFSVLSNHFHGILRNRIDVARSWSPEEVAVRWFRQTREGEKAGLQALPSEALFRQMLSDQDWLETRRLRLASPSWFMKALNHQIALRANAEDGSGGHFFAERFRSFALRSEEDAIACSLYVDLNEIRAGIASTPEKSLYSSACRRVARMLKRSKLYADGDIEQAEYYSLDDEDYWLAPIHEQGSAPPLTRLDLPDDYCLDVRRDDATDQEDALDEDDAADEVEGTGEEDAKDEEDAQAEVSSDALENSAENSEKNQETSAQVLSQEAPRTSKQRKSSQQKHNERVIQQARQQRGRRHGFLPMTVECYLDLLDAVGRVVRPGKLAMDANLPPLKARLAALTDKEQAQALGDSLARLSKRFQKCMQGPVDDEPLEEKPVDEKPVDEKPPDAPTGRGAASKAGPAPQDATTTSSSSGDEYG